MGSEDHCGDGRLRAPKRKHLGPSLAAAAAAYVAAEDADALDCGVCFLPLKPPIFQCTVGHAVCSPCRDRLEAAAGRRCYVCGAAMWGGYRRCHAMEKMVDSVRVRCPNAAHGCDATPPYHGRDAHARACAHAPCRCPGEACGFAGSVTALLDHVAGTHTWPCLGRVKAGDKRSVRLEDGFNFLVADCAAADSIQCLFLMNVARDPHGCAISVLRFRPQAATGSSMPEILCELAYRRAGDQLLIGHHQKSTFKVVCTDLSNGMPSLDGVFKFVIPNSVLGDDDKDGIQVTARIVMK